MKRKKKKKSGTVHWSDTVNTLQPKEKGGEDLGRESKFFGDHPREKKKNVSKTLRNKNYYKNQKIKRKKHIMIEADQLKK